MKPIVIAIDGYAGCGKSTTAKLVARTLGYRFIDSGAMYRAFTLYVQRKGIDLADAAGIRQGLQEVNISFQFDPVTQQNQVLLNGENVTETIRSQQVNEQVSEVAALAAVRRAMVAQQQQLGAEGAVVMDGRDIGTVVFPDAELKVFMSAGMPARVMRRKLEYAAKGKELSEDEIEQNLVHRDTLDTSRKEGPLRKAKDALSLDTSYLTIEDQVAVVLKWAHERMAQVATR
ncbi:MAG: (d)CMP kinase [Bacteroidetes bacterium]|nr:(d)CMP kinase [Bacteroidota bacterium]